MPIELQFNLTFDDYLNAQILHAKRNWWSRLQFLLWRIIFPVTGVVFIAIAILGIVLEGYEQALGWILVGGLFLACYRPYLRWRWKQCYRRTRMGPENDKHTVVLYEDKITVTAINAKSEINWAAVQSRRENDKIILLYLAPAKFVLLPKRIISTEDLDRLHLLMQGSIQKQIAETNVSLPKDN